MQAVKAFTLASKLSQQALATLLAKLFFKVIPACCTASWHLYIEFAVQTLNPNLKLF